MSFFKKIKDRVTSPNAKIVIQLNKISFALGENVEGTATITSNEEFDAKEVRCEFQSVETRKTVSMRFDPAMNRSVPKEVTESATLYSARPPISGPLHLAAGFSQSYPLSINVPAGGRPTFHGVDQNITWSLKGVIAIDGRPDVTTSTMEIEVLPQTAQPVIKEKEIIREVVMIPCKYCGALMQQTETVCPNCGGKRTG